MDSFSYLRIFKSNKMELYKAYVFGDLMQPMCMFNKVFARFPLLTRKNSHKKKCMSMDTHNLKFDTYCDLLKERKTHVNWHFRNWKDTYYQAT